MTLRRAQISDLDQIVDFLTEHAPFAMFPLSNLARYGFEGENAFSVRFWIGTRNGQVTDVLTLTNGGMAMPCQPNRDWAGAAQKLARLRLSGIIGPTAQVRGIETALGVQSAPRTLDHDEPHFLLELDQMTLPDGPGDIRPLSAAPEDVIKGWMLEYQLRALNTPANEAAKRANDNYARYVDSQSHVVLMEGDQPLAMTGFNATAPGIVQIGGVYTPPDLRGRGHARRALALHLRQAQTQGVTRATLFSASDMAARAYRAIGFERIGDWTLLLFPASDK